MRYTTLMGGIMMVVFIVSNEENVFGAFESLHAAWLGAREVAGEGTVFVTEHTLGIAGEGELVGEYNGAHKEWQEFDN
jgi:hypothetical protein